MASIRRRRHRWQAQIRRSGHSPLTRTFAVRADAEAWARQIETSIDRHGLPISKRQLQAITLGDLLTRYLGEVTPRKKSHQKERYRINRLLSSELGAISLASLGSHHIAAFRDRRLKEVGSQAVRHDLNVLNNVFTVAGAEWDMALPRNPLSTLAKPAISKPRERRISDAEVSQLLEAAACIAPEYLPDLIVWLIETGMRKGEALRLADPDFNSRNSTIIIRESKNGHSRTVPISKRAVSILMPRLGNTHRRPFPVSESLLRSQWARSLNKAGLTNLHVHDLRHEAVSRLFERGLSVPEVARISGHRDIRQLARYAHADLNLIGQKLG